MIVNLSVALELVLNFIEKIVNSEQPAGRRCSTSLGEAAKSSNLLSPKKSQPEEQGFHFLFEDNTSQSAMLSALFAPIDHGFLEYYHQKKFYVSY